MKEENTNNTGNIKFSEPTATHRIDPVICPPELWSDDEDWFEKELERVAQEAKEKCDCNIEECDCQEIDATLSVEELIGLLLDDHTAILNRLDSIEKQLKKIKKKI